VSYTQADFVVFGIVQYKRQDEADPWWHDLEVELTSALSCESVAIDTDAVSYLDQVRVPGERVHHQVSNRELAGHVWPTK
jgi:hypothetical protein